MIKNAHPKRCFLIVLFYLAVSLAAIAQNNPTLIHTSADFGMKCDGNTDDTQRFLNAIGTGQGSQNLYIIFVNGVCNISWINPITVPNYVTLDFTQQGSIFLKSGSTLNVNSAIVDQDYHPIFTGPGTYNISPRNAVTCLSITGGIACQATGAGGLPANPTTSIQFNNSGTFGAITNVAAGSSLVSNGVTSTPIFQTKQAIDVRDYGVDCTDSIDSTTALNNAITAAGNFGKVTFPALCKVKVSGTPAITISNVTGLEMEMLGRQANNCDRSGSSGLDYQQAYASGNTLISVLNSQRLKFKNLVLLLNGNADTGIQIDQSVSPPQITTDNIFDGICIANLTATRNSSFNGFLVSPTGTSNIESQRFRDIFVICSNSAPTSATSNGNGFSLPQNSNAVNEAIDYLGSTNCSKTLSSPGGQEVAYQHVLDSTGTTNTNVVMPGLNGGLLFSRFENGNIGVQQISASPFGPTMVMSNDFSNTVTVMDCLTNGCGNLTLINNERDSTPTNWINVHGHHFNNALLALNNRNFSFSPTDWNLGAVVFPDLSVSASIPLLTSAVSLRLTPHLNNNDQSENFGSPFIDLQSNSGASPQVDDYYIQNMPTGPFGAVTASTLVFGHPPSNGITPWFSFQGTMSGVGTSGISNPATPVIGTVCSSGSSSWSYEVVAHDGTGTTAASAAGSTALGCLNLASGANRIKIQSLAGCTFFDVYRTAVPGGGTPSTTGKIGTQPCYNPGLASVQGDGEASAMTFSDTGLAGDSTSPPSVNTTGSWNFAVVPTAAGGTPTITGTGACATTSTQVGGKWAGLITCTGTTGASTLVITPGITVAHGFRCPADDETTTANKLTQTGQNTTTCTISGTVNANDVIAFGPIVAF